MKTKTRKDDRKISKLSTLSSGIDHGRLLTIGAIAIFCLLGFTAYWPIYPGDPSRLPGCVCGDTVQSVWFLRWVPFAISHGVNPFFTSWIDVPHGANLAQNTLMPLLSILTAPITLLVSPVASFNFLAWSAFPISAGAMFYVVRRLTGSLFAAFIAGLLYGFSPYVIGQAGNHIMLSFIPLPPLTILTSWQLLIRQDKQPWLLGVVLAVEVIAQFLIEPEVLAITAMVIFMGVIAAAITYPKHATKDRLIYALRGLAVTTILSGVCLAYPILFMIAGPQHFTGPNFVADNPYRSDLYGLVVPTLNERFVPPMFQHLAGATAGGDYAESGDYMGVVLLLFVAVSVVRWRGNRWLVLSTVLVFLCWMLSLGPRLVVGGITATIRLPFAAFVHVPLLQNILPSRLSLAEWMLLPIVVALSIVEWQQYYYKKISSATSLSQIVIKSGIILMAIGVIVTLLPRWPYPAQPINLPSAFASSSKIIPTGTTMLAYPLPIFPLDQAMLWQATNGMRFRLLGGYIQNKSPAGTESEFPTLLSPPSVQVWLAHEQGLTNVPWTSSQPLTQADVRSYLRNNNVGAVVVAKDATNAAVVATEFSRVLGPAKLLSGVLIWTNVQSHLQVALH